MPTHVIILAAGQGKRMKSDLPKVAHAAAGRPLVGWVMEAIRPLEPESTVLVLGHRADQVSALLPDSSTVAIQEQQLGTGHATQVGLDALDSLDDDDSVMVLYGDMPLMSPKLITELAARPDGVSARMVTTKLADPTGYGRVIRMDGEVVGVVEDRDCSPDQLEIDEVNAGIYSFRAADLIESLSMVGIDNVQGEQYLTDVIGILSDGGKKLDSIEADMEEVVGINSQDQLADAAAILRRRINQAHLEAGVQILDPDRTYIDDSVVIEPGATIYPGVHLEGETRIGEGSRIGPDAFVRDSTVGAESVVWYAVVRDSQIGSQCEVGPYASLRHGTVMADGSKLGSFVETKKTTLGEGAKAPHLTYLGDATVGKGSNIGAGTITCNYDGYEKHRTTIGEDVFIGSDTMLVAPITIGDRAITGAGSAITRDVDADSLAVERSDQKIIPGYAKRRAERQSAKKAEE